MTERIVQALGKLFDRHRIVFWYDAKKELRGDFEALSLPGIEKLESKNNKYGLKYRLCLECYIRCDFYHLWHEVP
jgi:hypothetical protein